MKWRLSPDHPWQEGEPGAFARSAPGFEVEADASAAADPVARCDHCAGALDRTAPYCRRCVEEAFAASPGFTPCLLAEWMERGGEVTRRWRDRAKWARAASISVGDPASPVRRAL